ncbi:rust resistance kinase Lr10 [Vitis vinifera]|uniref:Protein kinase domain-containing protein n=1 Tax=Vitis vinifera TaxID=29760 RepID=F6H7F1_VITVI|nr:rust resistance kinase Lr10 [Vitis vinifera]|eukprot:XP_010662998.1 PREDICTED: rust resistance kinase Lr10-like [Vitis vinifera]
MDPYLCLFLFLFLTLFVEMRGGRDECMKSNRCGDQGPLIQFPFRLQGQPPHCGYPGFNLSCTENNQTMLELPGSVKLLVKDITYKSREIIVQDPDNCLARQLGNLNLSASPFQFNFGEENTFFDCSSDKTDAYFYQPIPCLSIPGNPVYAVHSSELVQYLNLSSCRRLYSASAPGNQAYRDYIFNGSAFSLKWSNSKICRLKKSDSTETECIKGVSKKIIVTGAIFGFFLLMLVIVVPYRVYSSNKVERDNKVKVKKFLEDYEALKPSRYSYADIKRITSQFKDKLGEGGYGTVYKGKLSDEVFVAVKILNNSQGNGEEFINEVATMGTIHHVNIVRLVGFCADRFNRALIYEYLPNESLEKFIFSKVVKNYSLSWKKLQEIAIGIAKGIEYLHQGCDQRILHFDIKPHNILLDHNFNPKISDFGLAKLCSKEQSAVSMTIVRGTMGYIAPEVLSRNFGNVSYKSDVYSFGMLLLEMVGGRKNIDVSVESTSQVYFPEWIYNHLDIGEELHIRIEEEGDVEIAKKLAIVGLSCIQWCPVDRPSMKIVVQMLEGEGDKLTMPPNPFASTVPTNLSKPSRVFQQELTIISELE